MSLAAAVRQLRNIKGLTQAQLVRRSGLSSAYVNQIVHGEIKKPGKAMLRKLAKGLSVKPGELMTLSKGSVGGIAFWASDQIPFVTLTGRDSNKVTMERVLYGFDTNSLFKLLDKIVQGATAGTNGARKPKPQRASRGRRSAS